jgi:hypothetical protein
MNAQAIELYKQALEFAYTTIGKDHADTAFFQGTVAGKLAELIVKECSGVALNIGCGDIEDELLKHFGVKL